MSAEDLTGRRFGNLVAVRRVDGVRSRWLCRCDCGNEREFNAVNLVSGYARSCGGCDVRRNPPRRFTREEIDRLAAMWADGVPVSDMAEELGTTRATIYRCARRHRDRFPSRRTTIDGREAAALERMWGDGESVKTISGRLGVSVSTVRGYLANHRDTCPQRYVWTTPDEAKDMAVLVAGGMSTKDVAEYFGVCESTVRKHTRGR
jgi:DNA-binding NarL/FixJ family response regulator